MDSAEYKRTTRIDSRRLIGYATRFSVESILPAVRTTTGWLGISTLKFIKMQAQATPQFSKRPVIGDVGATLSNGINDIDSMVRHVIRRGSGQLNAAELITMFQKDETIATVATHARFQGRVLSRILENNSASVVFPDVQSSILIDPDTNSIQTTEKFEAIRNLHPDLPQQGCPYAFIENTLRVDRLFTSFSKWANELSIRNAFSSAPIAYIPPERPSLW
jgi:hypothetical protein